MFNLFQSIFRPGADKLGSYPEDLIERAVERAVDGTDRRLRAVAGYKKALRPAVIQAIDHVVGLVDRLRPPLVLSRGNYGADPELNAYFASVEHMHEVLSRDPQLRQWRKTPAGATAEQIIMLLAMELRERNVLGLALEGNDVRRDVAQVMVNFSHHRLLDPSAVADDTRRLLKRRAFDHLLSLALARMAATQGERDDLKRERDLLRAKLAALAAGHWGFEESGDGDEATPDPQALQARIEGLDTQLATFSTDLLRSYLDILVEVLGQPEQHLFGERSSLSVDRQGIKQTPGHAEASEITVTRLQNSAGRSVIIRLACVAPADLPEATNALREAERLLL